MLGDRVFHRLADMAQIDWTDLDSAGERAGSILELLGREPASLRALVLASGSDAYLRGMAETHSIDRLVLYDALERGFRIRLHLYPAGHSDVPHDHRWSFASRILRGSYQHRIFSLEQTNSAATSRSNLRQVYRRTEVAGGGYVLDHRMIHTATAEPNTVSLMLRGPAVKE